MATAPSAPVAAADDGRDSAAAQVAGATGDARAAASAEVGVVHVQLGDDAEGDFLRLLVANGLQPVSPDPDRPSLATSPADHGPSLRTFSARSAPSSADAPAPVPLAEESLPAGDAILIEAPAEQIERVLAACNRETELIDAVHIEQAASARPQDWQRWQRGMSPSGEASQGFSLNTAQQAVVDEVLESRSRSDFLEQARPAISAQRVQQYRSTAADADGAEQSQVLFFLHREKLQVKKAAK